jgi:hypothetical protein
MRAGNPWLGYGRGGTKNPQDSPVPTRYHLVMSLSAKDRQDNINFALTLLLQELGSNSIGAFIIVQADDKYRGIYPTTWHEVVNRGYLAPYPRFQGRFRLTGFGWRSALELHSIHVLPDVRQKLGAVCKHLKDSLGKDRSQSVLVNVQGVAQATNLQAGFIMNVIDGQLIEHWLNRHGAAWAGEGFIGSTIMVPPNIGLSRL